MYYKTTRENKRSVINCIIRISIKHSSELRDLHENLCSEVLLEIAVPAVPQLDIARLHGFELLLLCRLNPIGHLSIHAAASNQSHPCLVQSAGDRQPVHVVVLVQPLVVVLFRVANCDRLSIGQAQLDAHCVFVFVQVGNVLWQVAIVTAQVTPVALQLKIQLDVVRVEHVVAQTVAIVELLVALQALVVFVHERYEEQQEPVEVRYEFQIRQSEVVFDFHVLQTLVGGFG